MARMRKKMVSSLTRKKKPKKRILTKEAKELKRLKQIVAKRSRG